MDEIEKKGYAYKHFLKARRYRMFKKKGTVQPVIVITIAGKYQKLETFPPQK